MAMPYYYRMIGIAPEEENQVISQNDSLVVKQNNMLQTKNEVEQNTKTEERQYFTENTNEKTINIETALFNAIISSNSGGSIKSYILKKNSLNESTLINLIVTG